MYSLWKKKPKTWRLIGSGAQGEVFDSGDDCVRKVYASSLGSEFSDIVDNPRLWVAQGEMEAWNAFYSRYDESFARAKIDAEGNLVMPKIPGIGADRLPESLQELESFQEDLLLFKKMVSQMMKDITGKEMSDQKDQDVLVSSLGSGNYHFLQVDFGEFGMYKLMEQVEAKMGPLPSVD